MKTYTERRIELGQDINNTWTWMGAHVAAYPAHYGAITEEELAEQFNTVFDVVKRINDKKRQQLQDAIDYETAHPNTQAQRMQLAGKPGEFTETATPARLG